MFDGFGKKEKKKEESQEERRVSMRIEKHFLLSYYEKSRPEKKHEITQLKNISEGGMCFITTRQFELSTEICIELKTPYLSGTTLLDGMVVESHVQVKGVLYATRIKFLLLNKETTFLLEKMMEFLIKGDDICYGED